MDKFYNEAYSISSKKLAKLDMSKELKKPSKIREPAGQRSFRSQAG